MNVWWKVTNIRRCSMIPDHTIGEHRKIMARSTSFFSQGPSTVNRVTNHKISMDLYSGFFTWKYTGARAFFGISLSFRICLKRLNHQKNNPGKDQSYDLKKNLPHVRWIICLIEKTRILIIYARISETTPLESANSSTSTPIFCAIVSRRLLK